MMTDGKTAHPGHDYIEEYQDRSMQLNLFKRMLAIARTTAALLFDEGEAREKDVLKYLTQGQIRLELCRDLL
jgi:hypothetical protein